MSGDVLSQEGSIVYASTNQWAPRWGAEARAGGYSVIVSELCGPRATERRPDGVQNPS